MSYRRWADTKMDAAESRLNAPANGASLHDRDPHWADGRTRPGPPSHRGTGRIALGIVLVVAAAVAWWTPGIWGTPLSLSAVHGLCSSPLGSVAQVLDTQARTGCGNATQDTLLIAVAALAGAALIAWGWSLRRKTGGTS